VRKQSRKTVVRNADHWASLDVRLDGKCVICGAMANKVETIKYTAVDPWTEQEIVRDKVISHGPIVCGHLFSRVAYSTRWDERDLYCLCSYCNIRMEDDPAVAAQLLDYARGLWGDDAIEDLHRLYLAAVPLKTFQIADIAEHWRLKYLKHLSWRENAQKAKRLREGKRGDD
jgi:hypothetical protein